MESMANNNTVGVGLFVASEWNAKLNYSPVELRPVFVAIPRIGGYDRRIVGDFHMSRNSTTKKCAECQQD